MNFYLDAYICYRYRYKCLYTGWFRKWFRNICSKVYHVILKSICFATSLLLCNIFFNNWKLLNLEKGLVNHESSCNSMEKILNVRLETHESIVILIFFHSFFLNFWTVKGPYKGQIFFFKKEDYRLRFLLKFSFKTILITYL